MTRRAAVIGAGLAGLACARLLRRAGHYVEVFDRERLIGGRIATTRIGLTSFDHGAQYLTARSVGFRAYLDELADTGYAARWLPRAASGQVAGQILPWYVGTPAMSAIMRPLVEGVRVHNGKAVHTIARQDRGWHIWFEDETVAGPFHAVAIAVPAPDARLLLGRLEFLIEPLQHVRMAPCWSVMVNLDEACLPDQDVFSDMSEVIRWAARNGTKPGRRSRGDQIVIHAGQAWSRETSDAEPDLVAEELWEELTRLLGLSQCHPRQISAHLWNHGLVERSLGESCVFSSLHMVGLAGDWCLGRLAEHAFESGSALARAMINAMD
ncbi:MAG: NAD(P)-binding protein [Hyphomicrobiaceae bacterium]|nr:NAD(P)-binding protein [Hyphomicrobiaceae bacterium]